VLRNLTRAQAKAIAKEEAFMLRFDEERALNALPLMLPTEQEREALDIVRRIGCADGEITPESEVVLERIERILGLDEEAGPQAGEAGGASAPDRSRLE
jgi:tellurite resistance protein